MKLKPLIQVILPLVIVAWFPAVFAETDSIDAPAVEDAPVSEESNIDPAPELNPDKAEEQGQKEVEMAPEQAEEAELEPAEDPEKLILDEKSKSLEKIIAGEVNKTELETGKKLQIRSMALTAYRDNQLEDLWGEIDQSVEEIYTALGEQLLHHGFPESKLSFLPEPPELPEESPISATDLMVTLGLAEASLRMKQGPESISEWPNWTFGDAPIAKSTKAHYDDVTARFGNTASKADRPDAVLSEFIPKNWVYLRLHQEIHKEIEEVEPPNIEIEGLIKVGNEFPQAKELAEHLLREEFLAQEDFDVIDGIYTEPLSEAIRDFQEEHDLQSDGILGPSTLKKIGTKDEDVRERLVINLHRARRLPDSLGDRYLIANLPAGEIYGVENDIETIRMRVVFGKNKAGQRTPIFRDEMETVVFRPYWNVPYSIAVGESQYSNLGYLANNGFKIISSSSGASLPLTSESLGRVAQSKAYVRQDGGTSNALGLVKFLFPNKHAVYFHDTPSKHLFKKSYRAYSHGCVRLQHPEEMANWALKGIEEWNPTTIKSALSEGSRTIVELPDHIPVYIVYFTAFPDPGKPEAIKVHRDYYDYDRPGAVVDAPGPKPVPTFTASDQEEDEKRGPFSIFRKNRTGNNTSNRSSNNSNRREGTLFERLRALQN
ncbi:MAG: L,D-transpeptidase family protein [Verrucomicrobiales bacterium]|nr:L,D-transpeptidase family protein [Verrucomicrobiales bacterium]